MKTYQFFLSTNAVGDKMLFNLPEGRSWAESDLDPSLSIEVLDVQDDIVILYDGTEVEIVNIQEDKGRPENELE